MNYIAKAWYYTGMRDGQPLFTWNGRRLYLTYPVPSGNGCESKTVGIDCGYDTGHMEFLEDDER